MKAVRFDEYGTEDVLKVADVPVPAPGSGEVLVRVKAAGINPGEAKIRDGLLHARWPATFPSGQGSDFAGVVERPGPDAAGVAAGDEVIGWVDTRSSQAEYVVAEAANLAPKPAPALGGGRGAACRGVHRVGRDPRRGAAGGRHARRVGRGRRRRLDHRPARQRAGAAVIGLAARPTTTGCGRTP